MPSLPYGGSTYKYLKETRVFDVNRTVSQMGLIPEIFRRQEYVVRSLHPTHPVVAFGALANWFVQGHENCLYGCGPGSPFEKLAEKNLLELKGRLKSELRAAQNQINKILNNPNYE